tara:strand:+ start:518 stop:745 length:228 start_codon:yes stop_codon:yes gene_type:complete
LFLVLHSPFFLELLLQIPVKRVPLPVRLGVRYPKRLAQIVHLFGFACGDGMGVILPCGFAFRVNRFLFELRSRFF